MKLLLPILFIILSLTSISGQAEKDTNSVENETNSSELEISNRIFGGATAGRDEYKYVARLYVTFTTRTSEVCSGVVLTSKIIITAAHCVERSGGDTARLVRAVLPRGGWYFFTPQEITVHHYPEPTTREPDVAILRKDTTRSTFMRNFEPAPMLPIETLDIIVARGPAKIAGWGQTTNSRLYSSRLQVANVAIMESATCLTYYTNMATSPNGLICTDNTAAGTCAGDWGGPLLIDRSSTNVLLGLSVFRRGSNCNNDSPVPSAYINLQLVANWLKDNFPELANRFITS